MVYNKEYSENHLKRNNILVKLYMEKLKEFGRKLMYGRKDYSPKVKKILKEFGDEPITGMYIMRTPISKVLRFIMNLTS